MYTNFAVRLPFFNYTLRSQSHHPSSSKNICRELSKLQLYRHAKPTFTTQAPITNRNTKTTKIAPFKLFAADKDTKISDKTAVEFLFLGTGAANPTPRRSCSGLLLRMANHSILFDCGEGVLYNVQRLREDLSDLNTIILTHNHGDHLFGLPTFLNYYWDKYPNNKLQIIGSAPVADWIYHSFEMCELSKYYSNFKVIELSYPIERQISPMPFPVTCSIPFDGQNSWCMYD
jgi:hypothetical protein